jgi:hypothetical protein
MVEGQADSLSKDSSGRIDSSEKDLVIILLSTARLEVFERTVPLLKSECGNFRAFFMRLGSIVALRESLWQARLFVACSSSF